MDGSPDAEPRDPVLLEGRRLGDRLFEVAEGVWRIPVPTGYAVGDVNLYWVDGAHPVLIDTGVGGDASFEALWQALETGGRHIEDTATLLLTHHHVDHAGNARRIREVSGCRVRVRRRAVRRLSDLDAAARDDVPGILAFLDRGGFSTETVRLFEAFLRRTRRMMESCPDLEGIDDGDVVTGGGGRRIRVHARPGHSSSDLVFELEGTGLLWTGDHVLPTITPNPTLEGPEPGDREPYRALPCYRDSLRKTEAMVCTLACPGHELPFRGLADRCRRLRDLQDRRIEEVFRILAKDGPMTLKQVSLTLFGRVHSFEIFLTLSEVRGALDILESEGRAVVDRSGPTDLFRAA
ncbi:MBL fold metallo-hydrolase [Myxococcota bacterium]|nr:MBL fold metallo-hydrolase [Myxococcota bacterium]